MELIRSLLLLFARQIPTPFSAPLHNNSRKKSGETLLATSSIHLLLLLSFYRPMTGKIQLSNPFLKTIRNLRNEEEYSNINKAKNGKIVHHVSVSSNDNSKGKTMYTLFNFRTLQKTVASTLAAYCEANASNEIKINGEKIFPIINPTFSHKIEKILNSWGLTRVINKNILETTNNE